MRQNIVRIVGNQLFCKRNCLVQFARIFQRMNQAVRGVAKLRISSKTGAKTIDGSARIPSASLPMAAS